VVLSLFPVIIKAEKTFLDLQERKIIACIQSMFFTHWVKVKTSMIAC